MSRYHTPLTLTLANASGSVALTGHGPVTIRRNYMLTSHRKDEFIEWMKEMLHHSFALDAKDTYLGTMLFIETLVGEHLAQPETSRLRQIVPTISKFHTRLPLQAAFRIYDNKYSISQRHCIAPSFNEIRHILNLAQVMEIGDKLKFISFDGDQTLYSDGGNFDASNDELALAIIRLLCHGVKVAVITAAGYGYDGSKYEHRLSGLLQRFIDENMTADQISNFLVLGGECNYLLRCALVSETVREREGEEKSVSRARLVPLYPEVWQAEHIPGPKPAFWDKSEVKRLLDIAEHTMLKATRDLKLRARIMRKERAIGVFPGGADMVKKVPVGHGSKKLKQEALDEVALRIIEAIRTQEVPITLPFCVFNGGTDTWLDIGNKSVGVAALQGFFNLQPGECLHVGDQFLSIGNDIAAREVCPCIWIVNPRETGKVLQHVLKYHGVAPITADESVVRRDLKEGEAAKLCVYTGEMSIAGAAL